MADGQKAALSNQPESVEALILGGADVNTRDKAGCTALWIAAANGHIEVIDTLISHKADVDARNYSQHLPLYAAVINGHADAALRLLQHGADDSITGIHRLALMSFMTDVFRGHEKEILLLVWHLRTYGTHGFTSELIPLMITFVRCILSLVRKDTFTNRLASGALEYYDDPVTPALFRFIKSISGNDTADVTLETFHAMLDRNHDSVLQDEVGSYSELAIDLVALITNFTDLIAGLYFANSMDCSSDPRNHLDSRCNTAAHLTNNLEIMRSLLENEADVNAENVDRLQPIHVAAREGLVEVVELLLQHGANVNAADVFGNRPLHDAVCQGLNLVQLLLQHGAELNIQNVDGKTPLHIAVQPV